MNSPFSKFRVITLVLLVGLAVRAGAATYWQATIEKPNRFRLGDSDGYWVLGERLAAGLPYEYNSPHARVFRAPGYPLLLSGWFLLFGSSSVLAIRILGAVLGTLVIYLVWRLARKLLPSEEPRQQLAADLAAWMVCFYPGAIAASILVLAEALFVPLMIGQLLTMVIALKSPCWRHHVGYMFFSGILFGLACLTRPSWLLFLPLAFCVGWFHRKNWRRHWIGFGTTLMAACLVMAPWWIRNYSVTNHFVLTTLQTGTSLYDGLNPDADGSSDMQFAPRKKKEYLREYREKQIEPENEFEFWFNERMKKEALAWARSHPGRVIQLAAKKFLRIWSPWPNSREIGSGLARSAIVCYFVPLLVLGVWGARELWRNGCVVLVCILPAVYFTGLHMIFVGSIRYRQPPMILVSILAGWALAGWIRKLLADGREP